MHMTMKPHQLTILWRPQRTSPQKGHSTAAQLSSLPVPTGRLCSLTSDVPSQAQWAQAVVHENEKLHQLTNLQKAIVSSLQAGHKATSAAVRRADELAHTSQHAQRDSLEAGKLHTILLQHTGHAKVGLCTLSVILQYSCVASQQPLSPCLWLLICRRNSNVGQATGITAKGAVSLLMSSNPRQQTSGM